MSKVIPDISHYETVSNWSNFASGVDFIYTKSTEGTSYIDSTLYSVIKNCEKYKVPYWLYAYLRKGDEKAQAEYLYKQCKGEIGNYFVGFILDAEENNKESNLEKAVDYLVTLPYKVGLYYMYSQYSSYKTLVSEMFNKDNTCIIEARYGKNTGSYNSNYPPHATVDLHQYTSKGVCPGLSSTCDLNRVTGKGHDLTWFKTTLQAEQKIPGYNYFAELSFHRELSLEDFLEKRGLEASDDNIAKIASANSVYDSVRDALMSLEYNGMLIRPSGLTKKGE